MKSVALTIILAAVVSACATTQHDERAMPREHSPQAVPVSSTWDARGGPAPNVDLQIYDNPDLHLAASHPGLRRLQGPGASS